MSVSVLKSAWYLVVLRGFCSYLAARRCRSDVMLIRNHSWLNTGSLSVLLRLKCVVVF